MIRTVVVPPAEEPLSLSAAKTYLEVSHDAEDDLIAALLAGGRSHIENSLELALIEQVVEVRTAASSISESGLQLNPGPVVEIVSVHRDMRSGTLEDITQLFELRVSSICVRSGESLSTFADDTELVIRFRAGFGTSADIPGDLQLALRVLLGQSYRNRDGAFQTNAITTLSDLLAPYREARL
ncbi:MAG: hypothetical protein AAF950_07820 [Pseudomonadota bacterium]